MVLNRGMPTESLPTKGQPITLANGYTARVRYARRLSATVTEVGYWPAQVTGECQVWLVA